MWKSGDGEHDRSGQRVKNSWDSLGKVDPHRGEHLLAGRRILQGTKRLFTIERGNPLQRMSEKKADFENFIVGSETNRNLSIKSETKCEFDRKECQAMQRIVPNIQ